MIRARYMISGEDIAPILALRRAVFVEELNGDPSGPADRFDEMAIYALAVDEDGAPAATGRLYIDADDRFRIDAVCVRRELRSNGLGDLVMRMLLSRALELSAAQIYLSCAPEARGFFAKYTFCEAGEVGLVRATAETIDREHACSGNCASCASDACQARLPD